LVGTLLLAPLSDRFGRKPVGLCTLTSGLIILGLSSLAPNGQLLLLARFCVSFLMGGSLVIISTFTMEVIPAEHRMILRTFCNWVCLRKAYITVFPLIGHFTPVPHTSLLFVPGLALG
jgi:MFS family permease